MGFLVSLWASLDLLHFHLSVSLNYESVCVYMNYELCVYLSFSVILGGLESGRG